MGARAKGDPGKITKEDIPVVDEKEIDVKDIKF